jgi:rhodanese-related sulfurtransferase
MSSIPKLTLNQKLGLVALVLGIAAIAATVGPRRTVTVNAKELLTRVERGDDHVTPAELAVWIINGRANYRLIDIRDAAAYATYHIPTAEHLPLSQVADGGLARSDKIVLYGDGGIHAAQAWMVLSGMGYQRVYTLLEGLDAWKDDVMFPIAPANPKPEERTRFERAAQVAKFFGGQPRAAVAPGAAPAEPPAVTPPAPPPAVITPAVPASSGVAAPPKKKREGC